MATETEANAKKRQHFEGTAKEKLLHRLSQFAELQQSVARKCAAYGIEYTTLDDATARARKLADNFQPAAVARGAAEEFAAKETVYLTTAAKENYGELLGADAEHAFKVTAAAGSMVATVTKSGAKVVFNNRQLTHNK